MNNKLKFTLRIPSELLKKIEFTAKYNSRSKNKEVEVAIKRYIRDFEVLHGNINIKETEN